MMIKHIVFHVKPDDIQIMKLKEYVNFVQKECILEKVREQLQNLE